MNKPVKITADLDEATMAMVHDLAQARGLSDEAFAAEAIRRVAESDADYRAFIQAGVDELDAGKGIPHEVVMAELDVMIARHEARCRN